MPEKIQYKGSADESMTMGSSWYPEMWPESEWVLDLDRMVELGFNLVRVFEFAWHRMEPKEGEFQLDWALRILDLCAERNIAVMIGTPSAAPPAWLSTRYPEILGVDEAGVRSKHGRRKHFNHHSEMYREYVGKIVTEMAKAFSNHPALHSWQIDNEMGGQDYGAETHKKFHSWLQKRYGTIDNLNQTWGLEFWSQAYDTFDQVPMAIPGLGTTEVPERHHPSLLIALSRFHNDAWSDYINHQCGIIRKYSNKLITTNMTPGWAMNWFNHNRNLDRVGHSLYRDVKHYHWNGLYFDRMRAEKNAAIAITGLESTNDKSSKGSGEGISESISIKPYVPYWLLETAPSWSAGGRTWNIHRDNHGVQCIHWMSTFLGSSMTVWWQWREHWAGQEMLHGTLVTATGRWRPNKEAMKKMTKNLKEHGPWLLANPPLPAQLGICMSNEAAWAFSIDPTDENMRYDERWREDFYLPLFENHIWRDVIQEDSDFSSYKVLVFPLMQMLKESTKTRLKAWVEKGGCLLLGPLTGYRSEEFTAFTEFEFGGLEDLIGASSELRFTVQWMEDEVAMEFPDGSFTRTRTWCEAYKPSTAHVVAAYQGGYGDGLPAILRNQYGKGTVITLGGMVDRPTYLSLVRDLMAQQGLGPMARQGERVVVVPRSPDGKRITGYGIVNISTKTESLDLGISSRDRFTGEAVSEEMELAPLSFKLLEV